MAVSLCRYRRILLCLCTPFILVLCLFVYVTLAVCLTMSQISTPVPFTSTLETFFVAEGSFNDKELAPHPRRSYWKHDLNSEAFWNTRQLALDRRHNPILRRKTQNTVTVNHSDSSKSKSTLPKLGCQPNYGVMWSVADFFHLQPQMQKFLISMHCRDYPLLIDQPAVCSGRVLSDLSEPLLLLLAIKSQAKNFENRQAIRQTWGHSGLVKGQVSSGAEVRRVFLLAKSDALEDRKEIMRLEEESKVYRDILMWDFMDAFFNLTLKDVLFWEWFSKNCQNAHFVFKGDDDVFVRTPALLDYLRNEQETRSGKPGSHKKMEDFVAGDIIKFATPVHMKSNKYYIPETFYKGIYPPYAGGGGVIYSGTLVLRLLQVSKRILLYPIDDVYVGMCLQRLGVIPIIQPAFLTFDFPEDEAKDPCAHHSILLVHKRTPKEVLKLWSETLKPSNECSQTTIRVKVSEWKKRLKPKMRAKVVGRFLKPNQISI